MLSYSILIACSLWASMVFAGYDAGVTENIAIYWGQNSAGAISAGQPQKNLAEYCTNAAVDIIPIAFLSSFNPIQLSLTNMDDDKNLGDEIAACQGAGKTILLSIGGAMFYTGPSSPQQAQYLADQIWAMFGPPSGGPAPRPFGNTVVDGFDLDIEAPLQNIAPFAARLRQHIDDANGKGGQRFYLAAAPQCPFPDKNNQAILHGDDAVAFDFIMVQFYNNAKCDIRAFSSEDPSQSGFNMDQWDKWAHSSKNPNVKVFLGIPGGPSAVTTSEKASYKHPSQLAPIISYSKKFSSFAGVMIWDMSQVWANPGFLDAVSNDVKCPPANARKSNTASLQRSPRNHQKDWKM
ncbi:glycoside hydrolase family 18 protein [Annulohypoxylon truncatum]|uniref:glycoside hydrolase family 18 protein n=1 Tax=Annulohypoxylon truncatum TaxID=327061 RepID=UPI002007F874|nr:glycoside hydrolase family 18 protein [Annulohypoxylon truncatum]KAI1204547.1 glycoside hydrolase family 18 protein [Annulohypoxylon truncatum]